MCVHENASLLRKVEEKKHYSGPFIRTIRSDAASFANGIKDHPSLLATLKQGLNEHEEKDKVGKKLEWV